MAKFTAVTWFPRSYIHLYQTFRSIKKIGIIIEDEKMEDDKITFTLKGFKSYPDIFFTQGFSGLHSFTTEVEDSQLEQNSQKYLGDIQHLLIEHILKNCHTVTYKQICEDVMTLDFHLIIQQENISSINSGNSLDLGNHKLVYNPETIYESGTKTLIAGPVDETMLKPLMYHAYNEVASAYILNMMNAMVRLYNEADILLDELNDAKDMKSMKKPMQNMAALVKESSERYGKLKQIQNNFKLKEQHYYGEQFNEMHKKLIDALKVRIGFQKLEADAAYMEVLWGEILDDRIRNINSSLDARLMLHKTENKGWF